MGYLLTNRTVSDASASILLTDTSGTVDIDVTVYQSTDGDFHFDNSQTVSLSGGSGEENTLSGFTASEDALYWAKIDITSGQLSNLTIETDSDVLISFDHESQWDSLQDSSGVSSSDVGVARSSDSLTHGYEYGSLTKGLVGYWTFDNVLPDESNIAYDEALGNHGTTNGATYTSGQIGQALDFDNGNSEYVDLGPDISVGNSATVTAWVNPSSFSGSDYQGIFTEMYNPSDNNVVLQLSYDGNSNQYKFAFHDGSWHDVHTNTTTTTGAWVHLVGTYDGETLRIFRNSVEEGVVSDSSGLPNADEDWRIGMRHDNADSTDSYWDGLIDELRLYDRSLSLPEIEALYNRTKPHMINVSDTL